LFLCDRPIDFIRRYVTGRGSYPTAIILMTPAGKLRLNCYSPDDVQTINEIFFREDYRVDDDVNVIVDFGSNIGFSCAYFLSRDRQAFCYAFEPLAQNVERLRSTLAPFRDRYELAATAVGTTEGVVSFGWEPTGRYGGIGQLTGKYIEVPCRDSNAVLDEIITRHGEIGLLKVDIETMEKVVVSRIPTHLAERIKHIIVEFPFKKNPLSATHHMRSGHFLTRFHRKW